MEFEKKAEFCPPPPSPAPPECRAGRLPGGTRGHFHGPCPPLVLGRTPFCSPPPPPPTPELLILELEGNEECGKYLKAAAGAREVLGAAWGGSRGHVFPETVQKCCRQGVQASRGPPSLGRGIWSRWSWAGGDHGFRLHSGQSFPGTPERPGNRTDTRPPSAPWLASGSAASSQSGRCPPHLRTASAPARC